MGLVLDTMLYSYGGEKSEIWQLAEQVRDPRVQTRCTHISSCQNRAIFSSDEDHRSELESLVSEIRVRYIICALS